MSDAGQESGWWLAADGKWHAPKQGHTPMAPPPPVSAPEVYEYAPQAPRMSNAVFGTEFAMGSALRPQPKKKRQGRSGLVALVAVLVVIAAGLGFTFSQGGGSSVASDSPKEIVSLVRAAVQKAGSVHVVTTVPTGQGGNATYVYDIASSLGRQVITFQNEEIQALVVGGSAYMNANEAAYAQLLQVPTNVAQEYSGKWIVFSHGGQGYQAVAQTLTIGSMLQQVLPTGSLTKTAQSTVNGQSVVGVGGALLGGLKGTLFVSASGPSLPVKETVAAPTGTTTVTFSNWGESVQVQAPSGAVSGDALSSQLGASSPAADRAAQSNLTNALTEAKAIFQNEQSYAPNQTPLTTEDFYSQAPEFSWTTQGCGAASPASCVSVQVVDAAQPGDGQGIVLAVYSPDSQNCWYAIDLESPKASFTDAAPGLALVTAGRSPSGVSTPGVFYAEEPVGAVSGNASTYCSGAWAATQPNFHWGSSFSDPGTGS